MNREDEPKDGAVGPPADPSEAAELAGDAPGETPDNVIAFPGRRHAPRPSSEGPAFPEGAADTSSGDADAAEGLPPLEDEPGMTLDAFERAVRSAVADRLGDAPSSPPRGADELVAQVFSALTGKDARSALSEVRARLADPGAFEDGGKDGSVIDLSAVREARQKQSLETASRLGGAIRDSFTQFLGQLAQGPGHSGGEITLDAGFFKQHGPTLLGNLFQSLASTFMQQARQGAAPSTTTPPTAPAAPEASAQGGGAADAPTQTAGQDQAHTAPGEATTPPAAPTQDKPAPAPAVQVRLDLGSLFSGLFKRLTRPPEPPAPSPEPPPEKP